MTGADIKARLRETADDIGGSQWGYQAAEAADYIERLECVAEAARDCLNSGTLFGAMRNTGDLERALAALKGVENEPELD